MGLLCLERQSEALNLDNPHDTVWSSTSNPQNVYIQAETCQQELGQLQLANSHR